jgi:hypothetical protein
MHWIKLAHVRDQWRALVNTVMNLQLPQNAANFLSSCTTGGFSRTQLNEVNYVVIISELSCSHNINKLICFH